MRFCICFQHRVFPFPWWYFPARMITFRQSQSAKLELYYYEKKWLFLAGPVVVVTHRKKLEEVEFVDKEFLHKMVNKNSAYMKIMLCYRRYSRKDTIHHAVKAAWVKHYGELTVLNWRRWLRYCNFLVVKPVDYFWLLYFVFSLVLAKLKTWCLIFVFSLVFQLLQLGRVW